MEFFDKVYLADRIAGVVRSVGVVVWIGALVLAAATIAWKRWATPNDAPADRPTLGPSRPLRPVTDEEMWV